MINLALVPTNTTWFLFSIIGPLLSLLRLVVGDPLTFGILNEVLMECRVKLRSPRDLEEVQTSKDLGNVRLCIGTSNERYNPSQNKTTYILMVEREGNSIPVVKRAGHKWV